MVSEPAPTAEGPLCLDQASPGEVGFAKPESEAGDTGDNGERGDASPQASSCRLLRDGCSCVTVQEGTTGSVNALECSCDCGSIITGVVFPMAAPPEVAAQRTPHVGGTACLGPGGMSKLPPAGTMGTPGGMPGPQGTPGVNCPCPGSLGEAGTIALRMAPGTGGTGTLCATSTLPALLGDNPDLARPAGLPGLYSLIGSAAIPGMAPMPQFAIGGAPPE